LCLGGKTNGKLIFPPLITDVLSPRRHEGTKFFLLFLVTWW